MQEPTDSHAASPYDEPDQDEPDRDEPDRDVGGADQDTPGADLVRDREPAEPNEPA